MSRGLGAQNALHYCVAQSRFRAASNDLAPLRRGFFSGEGRELPVTAVEPQRDVSDEQKPSVHRSISQRQPCLFRPPPL